MSGNVTFVDGQPTVTLNEPITVNGKIEHDKALKLARKKYGATSQVTDRVEVNDVYEISVEDFIKHATKIESPAPAPIASAPDPTQDKPKNSKKEGK